MSIKELERGQSNSPRGPEDTAFPFPVQSGEQKHISSEILAICPIALLPQKVGSQTK